MSETDHTPADYTMGYSEEFRQMLNWRSAKSHAAYLLPHLASGRKLLDFGCGPGTITVGLAGAATKYGLATQEQFDEWRRSLDEWKDDPGAFGCIAFGECLAINP